MLEQKWGALCMVELMKKLPGRSKEAIMHFAHRHGLGRITQGMHSIAAAARVMGVATETVMPIWEWAHKWELIIGKQLNLQDRRSLNAKGIIYLEHDAVVDAALAYFNSETLRSFCVDKKLSPTCVLRCLKQVLPPELLAHGKGSPFRYPQGYIEATLKNAGFYDPEAEHWKWQRITKRSAETRRRRTRARSRAAAAT